MQTSKNPQTSFSSILSLNENNITEISNNADIPGQNILDDVILKVKNPPPLSQEQINEILNNNNININEEVECPYSHKRGKISGCPFMNSINNELKNSKFEYHYEFPISEGIQDFRFNISNYGNKENIEKSKILRSMPKHLRNTIFIKNPKIEEIRKKEFPIIFLISEEMKEKAFNLYTSKKYYLALNLFNIMYSIFKWVHIKSKKKEENFLYKYDFKEENNLYDEDIEIRRINCKDDTYEESGFKSCLINTLKGLCYCYMNLRHYSEAVKCMDEAMSYVLKSRGEILFRRAQSIMYNKFSQLKELYQAHADLIQAKMFKRIELIDDHMKDIENLIKQKEYKNVGYIKQLFSQTNYAMDVITKKNLNVRDHIYYSYDDIYFGYKIVEEMKDTFYSSIKFYQDKLKQKIREKNPINKSEKDYIEFLDEFDKFFDFYNEYTFFMNLQVTNLDKNITDKLDDNDRVTIKKIKKNETMNLLFKDFRLKKAQEIYDNMDWNMTIWKHCFDTVKEREKRIEEEKKNKKGNNKGFFKKLITNPLSNTQHAIATFLFAFITLITIGLYAMYFTDKYNQNLK